MKRENEQNLNERSQLLDSSATAAAASSLRSLFERPSSTAQLRPYESFTTRSTATSESREPSGWARLRRQVTLKSVATAVLGSGTFLLYQVVFCLAQAATITPHRHPDASGGSAAALSPSSRTGPLAQMAALGVLSTGPYMIYSMHLPALYPASDLFVAPFLARIAERIDTILQSDDSVNTTEEDEDRIFLATLGFVVAASMVASGILCVLAGRFKVANLGAFLPYSVLCGFFATIGILMWSLGFHVDTGLKFTDAIHSAGAGDANDSDAPPLWQFAALHHAPSFAIGVLMHLVGPAHPLYVIGLVVVTVAGSYGVLWLTNTTLEQAAHQGWFYFGADLSPGSGIHQVNATDAGDAATFWQNYGPPYPFGVVTSLIPNHYTGSNIHWGAVQACLPTVAALSFLYLIRCSLHSAAVRKNTSNVTRTSGPSNHNDGDEYGDDDGGAECSKSIERATVSTEKNQQRTPVPTLGNILERGYGYSQLLTALVGGFPVAPSVAASVTMFQLGAEGMAPQYGSCLLVLAFYVSNFEFVQYIPKPAFSCLMVLAGLDMCKTWLVGSFFKTQSKVEWIVTPVLVAAAFAVGLLSAIVLGVALSTFLFAAHFYHSGIVRFVGNGVTLRSTVERGVIEQSWLDQNAAYIQILVLQHYLFFGNAQSVLNYVSTMFEEADDPHQPPVPLYLSTLLLYTEPIA
jgi:MFS superfamily sulfate permease-like transporter